MVVGKPLGVLFVSAVLAVTACDADGGGGNGNDDCATNRCEAGGGSGGVTGGSAGNSGAAGSAGASSGGNAGSGASGAAGTTGGNGGSATGGAQQGGSSGGPLAGSAGVANGGVGGVGGGCGGAGAGGLAAADPPLCALEGLWRTFRESPTGTCGVEPTTWTSSSSYFRLSWSDTAHWLEMHRCSDAVTCDTAPSGFELYVFYGGEWHASFQPLPMNGMCTLDTVRLRLLPDGVLRKIKNHTEIAEAVCSSPSSAYTCITERMDESRRAP